MLLHSLYADLHYEQELKSQTYSASAGDQRLALGINFKFYLQTRKPNYRWQPERCLRKCTSIWTAHSLRLNICRYYIAELTLKLHSKSWALLPSLQGSRYLTNYCIPFSDVASRQHLRSARRHYLVMRWHSLCSYGRRSGMCCCWPSCLEFTERWSAWPNA